MNKHPFLRAYLAGIAVPTALLLVGMTVFTILRYVYNFPLAIERIVVFPMAGVPNAWGLWNVLHLALARGRHIPLGLFGGALPLLLVPGGYVITRIVGFSIPQDVFALVPFVLCGLVVIYYLVWKYFVGFLNAELGIA